MRPILILGLGNPLQGDDGVGCRVAEELERIVLASRPERTLNKVKRESKEATPPSPRRDLEIASSQKTLFAMTDWNEIEVMDGGTPGIGLLNLLEGRARVILVDAAEMGLAPGEFRRFTADQVTLTGSAQRLSLHRAGVADALALARTLNIALPDIVFYGVQPASIEWRASLSPAVQDAVPRVIDAILDELNQSMKSEG